MPRKITDADVGRVIVKTLEETPKNATHWSTRSMAAATGMSQSTVSRIRRAFALAPHRSQTFELSTDPLFIDKVRDVVGLYLGPPDKALVHPGRGRETGLRAAVCAVGAACDAGGLGDGRAGHLTDAALAQGEAGRAA